MIMRIPESNAPIVFAFIAWMKAYQGATAGDVPVWARSAAPGGRVTRGKDSWVLGEVLLFQEFGRHGDEFLYGDVQSRFNTDRLGGDAEKAEATVIWCVADPEDGNRVKAVGYYREATVYRDFQPRRPNIRPPGAARNLFPDFNVKAPAKRCRLISVTDRRLLPSVPGVNRNGRWQAASKIWGGTTHGEEETEKLKRFV